MTGKCAVIVGATDAVGSAVSERFARAGASLVLVDSDGDALTNLAQRLEDNYDAPLVTTPGGPGTADQVVQQAVTFFGRIDVLVNNAPGGLASRLAGDRHAFAGFDAAMNRRLWHTMQSTMAVLPAMRAARWGRIIFIGGNGECQGLEEKTVDVATRGAVHAVVAGLADELEHTGVTFNAIDCTPTSGVSEIAAVAEFLAGSDSTIVNGQIFEANTGRRSDCADDAALSH